MIDSTLAAGSRMVGCCITTIIGSERVLLIESPHVVPIKFREA